MAHQPTQTNRVAILGGGVTGLTALLGLASAQKNGITVEPFLLEATDRLGGLIRTERIDNFLVEAGPDSFLTEKPDGIALAKELGLEASLVGSNDSGRRTYIFHRNCLVPLPENWLLFVPRRAGAAVTSRLLPVSSLVVSFAEAFRFWNLERDGSADESVSRFVRRHFGNGMLENVADPLLAGIYGGDTEQLSAQSVLPRFRALERRYGSLVRGLAKEKTSGKSGAPIFTTLRDGMQEFVESLVARAGDSIRDRIHLGVRATALEAHGDLATQPSETARFGYTIQCEGGASFKAGSVILALPAYECARLLRAIDSSLAADLGAIPYTPAVIVALGYRVRPANLPQGFGLLAPRRAGRRLLACTFVQGKFPFRAPEGAALLRCFLGGARDHSVLEMNDEQVGSLVIRELRDMLGVLETPEFIRVYRFPSAMPQYVVGHEERVSRIWEALDRHPGLFLAGNSYSGIGISDSIRTAKSAVEKVVNFTRAWQ
ncbi:MAG TPA: protoporphyrinogen oxidase, partial [Terriglobia bacterium]|nr:protoporphyrinogen oxidase [Terriglobia bacterium]